MTDWAVEVHDGPARELHALDPTEGDGRRIWVLRPTRPAIVLGSTQGHGTVDRAAATRRGLDVVRRRSGGGAVLVTAEDPVWVDVIVPAGDPLWRDDVGASFLPIGQAWRRVLESAALDRDRGGRLRAHAGPLVRSSLADVVCFAGVGPGELLVSRPGGDRKVLGISQRRSRDHARFQCALLRDWDPSAAAGLLRVDGRPISVDELVGVAEGIGARPSTEELVAALVVELGGTHPSVWETDP